MPRNRSVSASATSSPALLSRGFASIRRRLSASTPTSPNNLNSPTSLNNNRPNNETVNSAPRLKLVPNIGATTQGFIFNIIDRQLEPNVIYRIGRFSERDLAPDKFCFKSKVVSRNQAEIWTENGKVFIKDSGSSGGTFLNRQRLSGPQHMSLPHEMKDGDLLQFGSDYQGGVQPIYRAVRIRVEINRPTTNSNFNHAAFQQLRTQLMSTSPPVDGVVGVPLEKEPTKVHEHSDDVIVPAQTLLQRIPANISKSDVQECCICLYAIAPFQALFAAPCSHLFHFKCIRPMLYGNYPGFSCPLCRNYYDLESSVAVEVDEVMEIMNYAKGLQQQTKQKITPVPEEDDHESLVEENIPSIRVSDEDYHSIPQSNRKSADNLLSKTLVGESVFDANVVSSSTDNHA